ncbi:MAG: MBL fold metallo-hydrolase [Candidatus Eisenbacteria bacterium]|nr:MBL fold metallo-hydrolase [Candidatus Eisenbacteria bacterium]
MNNRAIGCILASLLLAATASCNENGRGPAVDKSSNQLKLTVVYDNHSGAEGLKPAWGFACVVEGLEKTILFDTGGDAPTLLANMAKLGLRPQDVEVVVLSHAHGDHTGGLRGFLEANSRVMVYLLDSFPAGLRNDARRRGADVVDVSGPTQLCAGATVTGEILGEAGIPEQSLVLRGNAGAAVVTGCAHPGIVRIVERAKALTEVEVLLALGGFHLSGDSDDSIRGVVSRLRQLGVRYAAPCHCSGDRAIELFADAYGDRFVPCVVGTVLDVGRMINGTGIEEGRGK